MDEFWTLLIENFNVKLLVFCRILGAFSFAPILSRNNIPAMVRIGASLLTTYIITLTVGVTDADVGNTVGLFVVAVLREMFIGIVIGFVMNMFFLMIQLAGDIMDSQSGLGMAKMFDPETKIQMSIFGSFISFLMYLYFFVTDCHLTVLKIFITSMEIAPVGLGHGEVNPELGMLICSFMSELLLMMLKLSLPVIGAAMILHFSMGVLMKAVPQIQIMVVNIQLMMALGMLMLYSIAVPLTDFIDTYIADMLDSAVNIIPKIFV